MKRAKEALFVDPKTGQDKWIPLFDRTVQRRFRSIKATKKRRANRRAAADDQLDCLGA